MKNSAFIYTLLFSLFIAVGLSTTAAAAPTHRSGNWEKLGTKTVQLKADHDVISVTRRDGRFTKLRFAVEKSPILLRNINIIFGNGSNMNLVINQKIRPGSFSRIIDLPGNKRVINKIKLNYKAVNKTNGRAIFIAWGKH